MNIIRINLKDAELLTLFDILRPTKIYPVRRNLRNGSS